MIYQKILKYYQNTKWKKSVIKEEYGLEGDYLSMHIADSDFDSDPGLSKHLISECKKNQLGYVRSSEEYFQTIIDWHKKTINVKINRENISTSFGVTNAIAAIIQTFTEVNDEVLVQPPVYCGFQTMILKNKRVISENNLILQNGKYQIDFLDFSKKVSDPKVKLVIICNPHNPLGNYWKESDFQQIIDICVQNKKMLFVDEVWRDLPMFGNKIISVLQFIDYNPKVKDFLIVANGPNKTFSISGNRNAYLVTFNEDLRIKLIDTIGAMGLKLQSLFADLMLIYTYKNSSAWLKKTTKQIEDNYNTLEKIINQTMSNIKLVKPEAGFIIWMDFAHWDLDQETLKEIFLGAKIIPSFGDAFIDNFGSCIRINLACYPDLLTEFISRLTAIYKNLETKK